MADNSVQAIEVFVHAWLIGYINPRRFVDAIKDKPAPHWGFYAQVLRSLMDSLLLFLPVALLKRQPPTPSYLTFIPSDQYYFALIWLTPFVFMTEWLLGAVVVHVALRLSKLPSAIDQILNLTGMAGLVIGAFLIVWDWFWFFVGVTNQYFLGISHLIIDVWWFVIVVTGLKHICGVTTRYGILMSVFAFAAAFPFAIIIMRAPF